MSEQSYEPNIELRFVLSERGYDAAKAADVVALDYNTGQLQTMLDEVAAQSREGFPPHIANVLGRKELTTSLARTAIGLFYGSPVPRQSDRLYHKLPAHTPLIAASALAKAAPEASDLTTKGELQEQGLGFLDIRPYRSMAAWCRQLPGLYWGRALKMQ